MPLITLITALIDLTSKILGYKMTGQILGVIRYVTEKNTDIRVKVEADAEYERYVNGWEQQKQDRE